MFATYERIVAHQHAEHQTNDREQPPNNQAQLDEPPWRTPETAPRPTAPANDMFTRMEAGDQRLRAKEQQQYDVKQLEQKQRDGFDPWNRQDKAN